MSLSFTTNFVAKTNSVLPLAQNTNGLAVRVVSQGSDTLGTLTVSGLQSTATWTLSGSVPGWVAFTTDSTGTICTLTFTGAQYQQDPYEFFVSCTDGVSTANFPIYLEVRQPFTIAANTSNPVVTSGSTLNIPSYDSTVADIQVQGFGLFNAQQGNCNFILPSSLPTGLNFVTSNEGQLVLRVSEPHFGNAPFVATDLQAGLQLFTTSPEAIPLTLQAYQPGSFYDDPDRTYSLTLSVGSQSQKPGVLDFGAGAYYDTINNVLSINAEIDVLLGTLQSQGVQVPQPLKYQWTTSGPLTPNSGGNISGATNNKIATYNITGTGAASVNLQVTDANSLPILNGLKIINFNAISTSNTSWLGTNAIKVGVDADKKFGNFGDTVNVTLSSPDGFNPAESLTLTLNVEAESSIENGLPSATLTNPGPITLNVGNPTETIGLNFPAGAAIGNKWVLKISAANATSGPTRGGYAQVLFECNGLPPLTVNGTTPTISSSTGTNITPIQLSATNSVPSPVTAVFELVGGSEFGAGVLGAPDGVFIDSQNRISGNATLPGTYKFVVAASATGYRRSYSSVITMTVTQVAIPLQITNPTSSVVSVPDNTNFTISWGISGNPTSLFLAQIPSSNPIRNVTGAGSASTSQVGSCVYSIYGQSYFGAAYSVPLVVISSSIATAAKLLPSPTIATIDENSQLTANWQPYQVNGVYAAYKGWNITLVTPPVTGTPVVVFTDGLENGGTSSARVFEEALTVGDYAMNMMALSSNYTAALDSNPWDSNHTFPTALATSNITFDNTNLLLGQTLTITLNSNYAGADAWQVVFPDKTSTGWLPLSTRSVAKSFTTPGAQNVIIQTQRDFGTANPPVKLRRQITQQIFVVDQQFNPGQSSQGALTGTLGIGGEAGFEITDASTGTVTPQPFEVVIRSIARDTITNELKLMVATSRFSNASSLLSTMAIDVFPMAGRPHAKELIEPIYILSTNSATSSVPVKITTTTLPSNSYVGKPMAEFKMQATGGTVSYSWYAVGLPAGLKMNIDGTISGTPTQLGAFTVEFAVMDSSSPAYIDETTLTFTIPTDLVITTAILPAATVGLSYENYSTNPPSALTIQNTGGLAPYTWAIVAGSAPIGITIDPSTGAMGGVPCTYNSTTDFSKTFVFTVQVTDAIGAKASKNYSIALNPAPLSFGAVNQPVVVAGEQFKLAVPIFGGRSPYPTFSFTDNSVVGSGLAIVNPTSIAVVAGLTPASLTITTGDTIFYPASYPNNIALTLNASGGVPSSAGLITTESYKFYVDPTAPNTLPGAVCYGSLLVASPTVDGVFQVTIKVIDSVGHIGTKILNITTQRQGAGEFTIAPYIMNTTGSSNPTNWTFTSLPTGLPDPVQGTPYTPGVNQYYCMLLLDNGVKKLSNTGNTPLITFSGLDVLNPSGITYANGNTISTGAVGADGVILLTGTPSSLGAYSFELVLADIINGSNVAVTAGQRFSLHVGNSVTGSPTPVIAVVPPAYWPSELDLDLNTLVPNAIGSFGWAYPLVAEGGTAPYTFTVQSGTNLPGVTTGVSIGGLPAFSSATTTTNSTAYNVVLVATDNASHSSVATTIPVKIVKSATQAIHILTNNIPAYLYVNRAIPANTYYVESDLVANWTATGLPAGITLSPAPGNRVYLQGTPTATSSGSTVVITATSATFGTTASATFNLVIKAQSALITAPSHFGATAVIGTQYRVVNNNAIVTVQYTGFQPGDLNLPLLQNSLGTATLGAPGTTIGGLPTTGNSSITVDGFVMSYDYLPTGPGSDTLSFNNIAFPDQVNITEVYPALVVNGTTVPYSVSEYTVTQTMAAPMQASGGKPPYSINITGVSDPRFVPINNGTASAALSITVNQFASSLTPYNCNVSMTVTDAASNSVSVTGQLQVTVVAQNYITVAFSDYTWNISLSGATGTVGSIVMNSLMSTPQLGHPPYTYDVTAITIPGGLGDFIQNSPTKRVLAFNETLSTSNVADVNNTLTPTGFYNVTVGTLPSVGVYNIAVTLKVTDSKGITLSSNQTVIVNISS